MRRPSAVFACVLFPVTAFLARAGLAAADFFQSYLGMRNEQVDMSELVRRFDEKIYSDSEFRTALEWVKKNCKEGPDINAPDKQHSRKRKDDSWATSVKMAMIVRDLMVGNPALKRKGLNEEALGHNAIAAGFQGQRAWTGIRAPLQPIISRKDARAQLAAQFACEL